MFVPFSCRQRCLCPSCHQKRTLLAADNIAHTVCAPNPHRQLVFTIPKRLRIYCRYDRSLLGGLARAAWLAVAEVYRQVLGRDDVTPGMVAGIQTFGQLIHYHPHIHAIVTDDGSVIYRAEQQRCRRFPGPAGEDLRSGPKRNFQIFSALDFLAEVTQHVPDKGEHLVRYYGWYSYRQRGIRARARQAGAAEAETVRIDRSALSSQQTQRSGPRPGSVSTWAMLTKRVYEVDPLECPHCGGQMKIVSFIERRQQEVIERILRHCGLWEGPLRTLATARAPPLARTPSLTASGELELVPDGEFLEYRRRENQENPLGEFQLVLDPEFL